MSTERSRKRRRTSKKALGEEESALTATKSIQEVELEKLLFGGAVLSTADADEGDASVDGEALFELDAPLASNSDATDSEQDEEPPLKKLSKGQSGPRFDYSKSEHALKRQGICMA
jgi:hypothetical protein